MFTKTLRFWSHAWKPPQERPCFLPNKIVLKNNDLLLRKFQNGEGEPILIGPPNAGHKSWIAWFAPGKSIVEKLIQLYPTRPIYAIDWLPAQNDQQGIDELVTNIKVCVEKIGGKAHLVGLCMCGWLFAIYAALFPESTLSLLPAGSPLNTDGGKGGKIYEWSRKLPLAFFQALAPTGVWWGGWSILGFKGMTLEKAFDMYIGRYYDLWRSLDNPDDLERYDNFWDWFDDPNLMSFGWMGWIIANHFQTNNLYRGKCEILGRKVDFKNIRCRISCIAGKDDDITMPGEILGAFKGAHETIIDNCGHIGIYISPKALKQWELGLRWAIEGKTDAKSANRPNQFDRTQSENGRDMERAA